MLMAFDFDAEIFRKCLPFSLPHGKPEQTFVYLMRCDRFTKVGIAWNVNQRRDTLQRCNPFPIKVATKYAFVGKRHALAAERFIHAAMPRHRVHGEWFDAPYDEIRDLTKRVVAVARDLEAEHERMTIAHYEANRVRYESDPEYRAEMDANLARLETRWRSMEKDFPPPP
jgi:hypothetical protein